MMKMGAVLSKDGVLHNSLNSVLWELSTMEGRWWEPVFSLMEQKVAMLTTKL